MKIFLFLLILTSHAFAEIKQVKILGNKRISSNTIENLIDKKVSNVDALYINNLTRIIYNTDFFSNVRINYENNTLNIIVEENPIINFFYINGLTGTDLDEVNKIVSLKENSIFSTAKLKKDFEDIKQLFNSSGYYFASIEPEIIKIDDNQLNLIWNINKKELSKIKNIYFIGEKYFKDSDLIEVISSKEHSWWKLFSNSSFSEERIEQDIKLIKFFYKSKGFYDVQIQSNFVNIDSENNFNITYSINSGNKYKFGIVELKNDNLDLKESNLSDLKNISDKFINNKTYSIKEVNFLEKKLTIYLDDKRYTNYLIDIEEIKSQNNTINLLVNLSALKRTLIGKINVYGNTITEEKVVRDNLSLSEGDILNISKIKKSKDNLESKNIFKKIEYKISDSVDQKNSKDVNFYVKEQATGSISAGVGFGSSGGLLEGSVNERNFLGKGIDLNFVGRLSSEKISGVFSYIDPNFKNSEKELANYFYTETDDYSSSASSLMRSRAGSFTTTALAFNLSADFRDSKSQPTSGSLLFFDQSYASLFSDVPTVLTSVGSTFYQQLFSDKFIGSARLKLSNATAFDNKNTKLSDRTFTSNSDLRGFESRGIGPVDSGSHIGGNYLALLNLKASFPNPIPEFLRPKSYLFYDIANVWGVDYSDTISDSSKLRTSIGAAFDITTPVGPLSFTYGIPLSKVSTDKEQRFLFNIGSSF